MPRRSAIFIDGGYLHKTVRELAPDVKIDYQKLADLLSDDSDLLRTYYYDCPPYKYKNPTPEQLKFYASRDSFFDSLRKLSRFEVRLGKLALRGHDRSGKPVLVQKRVDILLGVDMVQLSSKGQISKAILIAGDSDFLPAVRATKNNGVLVHLYYGSRYHIDLWEECDLRTELTPDLIAEISK